MIRNSLALLLCGLSIGWLVGTSVTPVVKEVLISVLGVATALLTALAGLSNASILNTKTKLLTVLAAFNALPLGLFLITLTFGTAAGVYSRTNDLLGVSQSRYFDRWAVLMPVNANRNDSTQLLSHLFYKLYGISPGTRHTGSVPMIEETSTENSTSTRVYSTNGSTPCDDLTGRPAAYLRQYFENDDDPVIKLFMSKKPTDGEILQLQKALCH